MSYAQGTTVPITKSITELDRMVSSYGASGFVFARDDHAGVARVMFVLPDAGERRMVRFDITRPDWREFRKTKSGQWRTEAQAKVAAEGEERRKWRALLLVIKALLVAVDDGVFSLSEAFLPHMVLPGGQRTVGQWASEQLPGVFREGLPMQLLPGARAELTS